MSVSDLRSSLPSVLYDLSKSYPSLVNIPVQWGEQDAFGKYNPYA